MNIKSVFFKLVKKLPLNLAIFLCRFIIFSYLLWRKDYRTEIKINYQKVFSNLKNGKWFWLKLSKRLGENFGVMLKMMDNKKILDKIAISGENILNSIFENSESAVVVSFHYGLWELLPQIFKRMGYETYIAISRQKDKDWDEELRKLRSQNGVGLMETIAEMKRILKSNGTNNRKRLLGFVLDNKRLTRGLCLNEPWRNFFILRTPFVLAQSEKVPLLGMFCYKKANRIVIDIAEVKNPKAIGERLRHFITQQPEDWIFWGKRCQN